jgi:heptosyltransferase-2
VIQTSFLGDLILTTPLIAELAKRGPVDVLVTPRGAELLANNPHIRRVIVFDKRGAHRGLRGLATMARLSRASSPDSTAYCVQGSARTALLAWLAGYQRRVGFDTSAGRWLYTRRVRYRGDVHHAERVIRLAAGEEAPITASDIRPRLFPGDAERRAVDALLGEAAMADEPLIALAPGSVWATKRWPYFAELARRLTSVGRIIVVGGPDDASLAQEIRTATGQTAIDATGALSLLASAELIARCILLVTNDSAPQHLASAMATPTLTIFGPTVPAFGFGPLASRSAVAGHLALSCRPCHPHGPAVCPLGHWRCMRELGVEQLMPAALRLIDPSAA